MSGLKSRDRLLCASLRTFFTLLPKDRSDQKLLILIFHRVLDTQDFMRPAEPDVEEFLWEMEIVSRYFSVLPLTMALKKLEDSTLPPHAMCITFDDGYADNLLNAVPILKRFNLTATFYIATGFLEGGRMWNDTVIEACRIIQSPCLDLSEFDLGVFDLSNHKCRHRSAQDILGKIKHLPAEKRQEIADYIGHAAGVLPNNLMLSNDQLRELAKSGMEIGGHTVTHPILSTLLDDAVKEEIENGKSQLEALLNSKVDSFAYPNGMPGRDYLQSQSEIVAQSGFKSAVSTKWGVATKNSDVFQLPRFTPWDKSPIKFMLRLLRTYLAKESGHSSRVV